MGYKSPGRTIEGCAGAGGVAGDPRISDASREKALPATAGWSDTDAEEAAAIE